MILQTIVLLIHLQMETFAENVCMLYVFSQPSLFPSSVNSIPVIPTHSSYTLSTPTRFKEYRDLFCV